MKWVTACASVVMLIIVMLIGFKPANAQNDFEKTLELQQKILFIIAQTVGQICYTIEEKGQNIEMNVSLQTATQLRSGLTRIAALDVNNAERYTSAQYQGVLQSELGATIDKTQNCKQDVFNKLIDRMMPVKAVAPVSTSGSATVVDGSKIVQDFYLALGRGDGVAASSLVIPEKRGSGPFNAKSVTEFYSSLSEPLQLLGLTTIDSNNYQATYTYRAGRTHICAGSAIVTVVQRNSRPLIEGIRALQGC